MIIQKNKEKLLENIENIIKKIEPDNNRNIKTDLMKILNIITEQKNITKKNKEIEEDSSKDEIVQLDSKSNQIIQTSKNNYVNQNFEKFKQQTQKSSTPGKNKINL